MTPTAFGRIACVAGSLCSVPAGPAFAEERSEADEALPRLMIDEIVVTARRREERLRDVPGSVSVLSALELERSRIDDLVTLQYAVPNLTVTPYPGSPTNVSIAMRGQVESEQFPTLDPAVGVYLDGVYIARSTGANVELFDVERVEVLYGPQGTLFGRNTIGGAISLIPVKPGPTLQGELMAGAGNYDRRDLKAMVNVPTRIGAMRITGVHTEHSGYGRNVDLGRDLNEDDTDFLRAQLSVAPADDWDLLFSFDLTRADVGRNLLTMLAVYPPVTAIPATSGNPDDQLENYQDATARDVHANRIGPSEAEVWGVSGTLSMDFGTFRMRAISAYREMDHWNRDSDLDGSPYDVFTVVERAEAHRQLSHEVQAFGDALGDRLRWIGGLHYFDESSGYAQRVGAVVPATLAFLENIPQGTARNDSIAAFAELTYEIAPRLRVTGGLRYSRDGRQLISRNARSAAGTDFCTLDPGLRDEPDRCEATLPERHFDYVPWTLGLDFNPAKDALFYVKASQGHRSGGYNMRGTTETDLTDFGPERVTAFEIGGRAALYDHRLSLGLALFRSLFDDIQLRQLVPLPGTPISLRLTQNGGEARIQGGEIKVVGLVGKLRLAGAVGVVDAKYTRLDPMVEGVTRESQFLHTPATTASIAADLPFGTPWAETNLHLDYAWRSEEAFAYDRESPARQGPFAVFNATIASEFDGGRFELLLWARNILDQRYLVRAVDMGALVTAIPGDPRTYGVSLTYRFDGGQ